MDPSTDTGRTPGARRPAPPAPNAGMDGPVGSALVYACVGLLLAMAGEVLVARFYGVDLVGYWPIAVTIAGAAMVGAVALQRWRATRPPPTRPLFRFTKDKSK